MVDGVLVIYFDVKMMGSMDLEVKVFVVDNLVKGYKDMMLEDVLQYVFIVMIGLKVGKYMLVIFGIDVQGKIQ